MHTCLGDNVMLTLTVSFGMYVWRLHFGKHSWVRAELPVVFLQWERLVEIPVWGILALDIVFFLFVLCPFPSSRLLQGLKITSCICGSHSAFYPSLTNMLFRITCAINDLNLISTLFGHVIWYSSFLERNYNPLRLSFLFYWMWVLIWKQSHKMEANQAN